MCAPDKKTGRKLEEDTARKVLSFFDLDYISRMMPGKNDFVNVEVNGEQVQFQKRLLLMNLREAHKVFLEENVDNMIGLSKFCTLKPKHVILLGTSGTHNVCVL